MSASTKRLHGKRCHLAIALAFFITVFPSDGILATSLQEQLKGKILLQTEPRGEAWYVNPIDYKRYYLGISQDATAFLRMLGVGISNTNLKKIKVADVNLSGQDSDNDGLSDAIEDSFDTNKHSPDTDGDGYNDKIEILNGYDPKRTRTRLAINSKFSVSQKGKILFQVQSHGEAWYVNPADGLRYFLGRPVDSFSILRSLGVDVSDRDLAKIPIDKRSPSPSLPTTILKTAPQAIESPNISIPSGCQYNNPSCGTDYACTENICVLKKKSGCTYNNPPCGANYDCVGNQCVLKSGCTYNKPPCGESYNCVNNQCLLKSGCLYNNPACETNYDCINNACILKPGCQYNNPICEQSYSCINNQCKLKDGCLYGNPACNQGDECINNNCKKSSYGCLEQESVCRTDQICVNNQCVVGIGCQYDNPICGTDKVCMRNACFQRQSLKQYLPDNTLTSEQNCKKDEVYINGQCQKAALNIVFYSRLFSEQDFSKYADSAIAGLVLSADLQNCKNNIRIHKVYDLCLPKNLNYTDFRKYFEDSYGTTANDLLLHPSNYAFDCNSSGHITVDNNGNTGVAVHEIAHMLGLWDQYCYYPPSVSPPNPVDFNEAECKIPTSDWFTKYCSVTPTIGGATSINIAPFQCIGNKNRYGGHSIMGSNTLMGKADFGFSDQEIKYIQQKLGCNN